MNVANQNQKSRLTLSLSLMDSEQQLQNEFPQSIDYTKPIYSMKNSGRPSIKFSFDQQRLQQIRKKQRKTRLLAEREVLLNSLHALKGGAIMAIAQKQEQIEQLRQQLNSDDANDLQQAISTLMSDKKELLEEIAGLEEKLKSERQSYTRLLEEKDLVIEELYVQMESSQVQLEKLQKFVQMKEKEISIIAEQNAYLLRQLQIQHIQKINNHQKEQNEQSNKEGEKRDQNQALAETGYFIENGQDRQRGQFTIQSAIKDDKYREQIQSLTDYFEQMITEIRQIYQKKLHPLQEQSESKQNNSNYIQQQVPSIRETSVNPHLLSKEFYTPAHLSDCYSLTKKFESKFGSQKASIFQRDQETDFKFVKKAIANPSTHSRTSTSIKKERKTCIVIPKVNQLDDNEKVTDKLPEKQMFSAVGSFIVGALTGGSAALLFYVLGRR